MYISRETVLVNRGWVPLSMADPRERQEGQLSGPVKLTGLLRCTERVSTVLSMLFISIDTLITFTNYYKEISSHYVYVYLYILFIKFSSRV